MITQEQKVSGNAGGYIMSATKAFPNAVKAGSTLIAFISVDISVTSGISDNRGNTWVKLFEESEVGSMKLACYYVKNANAGSTTITYTASGWSDVVYAFFEYSGLDNDNPLDLYTTKKSNGNYDNTVTIGSGSANSEDNSLVLSATTGNSSAATVTTTSPFSMEASVVGYDLYMCLGVASRITSSKAVQSTTFNLTDYVLGVTAMVIFKEVSEEPKPNTGVVRRRILV